MIGFDPLHAAKNGKLVGMVPEWKDGTKCATVWERRLCG